MVGLSATCESCDFDNPHPWTHCARCGQLLGPATAPRLLLDRAGSQGRTRMCAEAVEAAPTCVFRSASESLQHPLPLLGREEVLCAIRRALQTAFSSSAPSALELYGPAGSGRTRVLMAASEVAAQGWLNTRVLYTSCAAADGPYGPYARLLLERFGVSPASSPARVRADMAAEVARVMSAVPAARLQEITQLLGHIAGIPFPNSPYATRNATPPPNVLDIAQRALTDFLRHDAAQRPLLLLLDDVPTSTPDTVRLLCDLTRSNCALQIIFTRCATAPSGQRGVTHALPLQPLDQQAVVELTHALVPGLDVGPPALYEALLARTAGYPRALGEVLRTLKEVGVLQLGEHGPHIDLERMPRAQLPLQLAESVRTRLDQLKPSDRECLQLAAINGTQFWVSALCTLAQPPPAEASGVTLLNDNPETMLQAWLDRTPVEFELQTTLARLEQDGFICRQHAHPPPDGLASYRFCDDAIRHALYGAIPADVRREKHSLIAAWLGNLNATQEDSELLEALAHHQLRAGLRSQAAQSYLRAAIVARTVGNAPAGLRLVRLGIPYLAQADRLPQLKAHALEATLTCESGTLSEALHLLSRVCGQALAIGARDQAGQALRLAGAIKQRLGDLESAHQCLRHARSLCSAAGDDLGLAAASLELALLYGERGEHEAALTAAEEALHIYEQQGDRPGQAAAFNALGALELKRGELGAAQARFEAAESHLNRKASSTDHAVLAITQSMTQAASYTQLGHAQLALLRDDAAQAADRLAIAHHRAESTGQQLVANDLAGALIEALIRLGRETEARATLCAAAAAALRCDDRSNQCHLQRLQGSLALRFDPPEKAQEELLSALELAESRAAEEAIALAHRELARFYANTDNGAKRAKAHYQAALEHFAHFGAAHAVALTEHEYGHHLLKHEEPDAARHILADAMPVLRRLDLQVVHDPTTGVSPITQQAPSTTSHVADKGATVRPARDFADRITTAYRRCS